MRKTILILLAILALTLFFTACDGEGLFYTIENEELVEDNNMANIKFSDVIVTDNYYVARGVKLWYRKIGSNSWSKINRNGDFLTSMAFYQGKLYYIERDGSTSYLYEMDIDHDVFTGTLVDSYSPENGGDYTWLQLFADPDETDGARLFMNAVEYKLDDKGDPTTITSSELYFTNATTRTDIATAFESSVFTIQDDGDGDYWPIESEGIAFGSGNTAWLIYNDVDDLEKGGLLFHTSNNFSTVTDLSSNVGDAYYNSVYYADTIYSDWLLLGTRTDWSASDASLVYVYDSNSNNDWNDETWNTITENSDGDVSLFSGFSYNPVKSNYIIGCTNNDYYTSGEGYVLIDATDAASLSVQQDDDNMADSDNYESSDLEDSTVYAMAYHDVDGTDFNLVAGTSTGVWTFDSTTEEWTQE